MFNFFIMVSEPVYIFGSVLLVSLISVLFAVPFLLKKKVTNHTLLLLLSISVGVLLGAVFFDFMPEIFHEAEGREILVGVYILSGFLIMFVIEKFVHFHHHYQKGERQVGHAHAYNIAPVNLIGDGVHNFIDGLVIAASYMVNINLGIVVTVSIIFHEIPQEIADFGVLLYSGLSKKKALFFNFISALAALLGAVIGFMLHTSIESFHMFIIPFAAGNFLYIASSNLLPELHRHCHVKESIIHILAIIAGIGVVLLITIYGPGHVH